MITLANKTFYVSAESNRRVDLMLPRDFVDDDEELLGLVAIELTAAQAKELGAALLQAGEIAE